MENFVSATLVYLRLCLGEGERLLGDESILRRPGGEGRRLRGGDGLRLLRSSEKTLSRTMHQQQVMALPSRYLL